MVEAVVRMPVIFAAHGAPVLLDDEAWMSELAGWAKAMPKPKSVLMVSAHWEQRPTTLGATRTVPLVYDFYGFPEKYYRQRYPSPGAPELAGRVRGLLDARGIPWSDDEQRGLDHGAYVPLVAMYPEADVPCCRCRCRRWTRPNSSRSAARWRRCARKACSCSGAAS